MSRTSFQGLIEGLEGTVKKLQWKPAGTEWGDYYAASASHYSEQAQEHKRSLVTQFLTECQPKTVWDLGANTGLFSRLASSQGIPTVAFDIDPAAVEQNYRQTVKEKEEHMLPLLQDLTNPSPAIGWDSRERMSLKERGPVDAVLALALIHHLTISNNVPLPQLAEFFHQICRWLIVEFVPKTDTQVQILLANRVDIFDQYDVDGFEKAFGQIFEIRQSEAIVDSGRSLYLMEAR
jgi:ribosomal protein L11 methylase PrmA